MTIDEAIKHAEEVADGCERMIKVKAITTYDLICAKEHRQLAEWLKDYKRLLEQEPCEDCISRQTAIDAFERFIHELAIEDEPYNYGEMALSVQNVPSVTPAEKVGQWISTETKGVRYAFWCRYKCSLCGELSDRKNFCPNCGAKMQEVEE